MKKFAFLLFLCLMSIMNTQLGEIKAGNGKISTVLTSGLCCV